MKYLVQVFSGKDLILMEECLEWSRVYQELTLKYAFDELETPTRTVTVLLGRDTNVVVTEVWSDETP